MKKAIISLVCVFALLVSLNITSAKLIDYKEELSITKYYKNDNVVVTQRIYANYDNDNRFSTYDYRHGYSYRTSKDYWEDNHNYYIYEVDDSPKLMKSFCSGKNSCQGDCCGRSYEDRNQYRDYDAEYSPVLRRTKVKKCYSSPPRGRLFYIKC